MVAWCRLVSTIATTHTYIEADLTMKERALDAIAPSGTPRNRYRASDALLKFLEDL